MYAKHGTLTPIATVIGYGHVCVPISGRYAFFQHDVSIFLCECALLTRSFKTHLHASFTVSGEKKE